MELLRTPQVGLGKENRKEEKRKLDKAALPSLWWPPR